MKMTNSKILFHNIAKFGDAFVSLYFELSQLCGGGVFSHNAIGNLIVCQKLPIWFTSIAFIGIDFFNRLFCVSAIDRAVRQIVGIVDRSLGQSGGQDEAVVGVHGGLPRSIRRPFNWGMFLQAIVGDIVFDDPV